jgi:ubiquitin carboxyl-terminal hydrolase 10
MSAEPVELPVIQQGGAAEPEAEVEGDQPQTETETIPPPETPSTSQPVSEAGESTNPTTPSSLQHPSVSAATETTPVATKPASRTTVPAVPVIPAIPKTLPKDVPKPTSDKASVNVKPEQTDIVQSNDTPSEAIEPATEETKAVPPPPKAWTTPKLWTGLFNPAAPTLPAAPNGSQATLPTFGKTNAETLAEALKLFDATAKDAMVSFLKPRGLVNTGNMCYMNSVGNSIPVTRVLLTNV